MASLQMTSRFAVFDAPGVAQTTKRVGSKQTLFEQLTVSEDVETVEAKPKPKGGKEGAQGSRATKSSAGKIKEGVQKIGGAFTKKANPEWLKERNGTLAFHLKGSRTFCRLRPTQ